MSSTTKQEHLGEEYLVEITDDAVEIWRIITKIPKGIDRWTLTLGFHEHHSLPLSAEDARNLVAEFLSDSNPETQQSIIESLSR